MWDAAISKISLPKNARCLVLGIGGGTAITIIQKKYPESMITAVEIDPLVLAAAETHFAISESKHLHLVVADALTWISQNKNSRYDFILVDMFLGILNPKNSREEKFFSTLKTHLTPKGIILYNAHFQPNQPEDYSMLLRVIQHDFKYIEEIFKYTYNRVLKLHN